MVYFHEDFGGLHRLDIVYGRGSTRGLVDGGGGGRRDWLRSFHSALGPSSELVIGRRSFVVSISSKDKIA